MGKHSRRRIRELFTQEIEEKTYFEFRFSLDGTLVKEREDQEIADDNRYVDEDGDFYPEDQTIVFRFNSKVKRELAKTFRRILKNRNVAPLDSITLTHPEVRQAIDSFGKNVDVNTKERIRQEVVSKYEPEYEIALYESVLLVMVEKDLFKPTKINRGGISVDTKIEVVIPDDFWASQSPEIEEDEDDNDDLYDTLKYGNYIEKMERIIRDRNNPLEYMIAVVDTLMMDNEELGDAAAELAKVVVANVYVSANREAVIAEGLEPFRQRMEKLLPEFMGGGNSFRNGDGSHGGISIVFGTDGKKSSSKERTSSSD